MEHWLERVYRDHVPALFRFLMRLTGREADAHDILQEIFVRLARSPRMLDDVAAPRSYLFRMAHRMVIDSHRREQARHNLTENFSRESAQATYPPLPTDEEVWRQKNVAASLEVLPLEQKAVVVLKVWEEMSFAEIAAVLDIPPNTAASRYRYALDKLREALRPLHEDTP